MPKPDENGLTSVDIARGLIATDDDPLAGLIPEELGQRPTYTIESSEGVTTFPGGDYDEVVAWLKSKR